MRTPTPRGDVKVALRQGAPLAVGGTVVVEHAAVAGLMDARAEDVRKDDLDARMAAQAEDARMDAQAEDARMDARVEDVRMDAGRAMIGGVVAVRSVRMDSSPSAGMMETLSAVGRLPATNASPLPTNLRPCGVVVVANHVGRGLPSPVDAVDDVRVLVEDWERLRRVGKIKAHAVQQPMCLTPSCTGKISTKTSRKSERCVVDETNRRAEMSKANSLRNASQPQWSANEYLHKTLNS